MINDPVVSWENWRLFCEKQHMSYIWKLFEENSQLPMYVEIKGDIVNTDSENFGVRKFDFFIVISIFYVVSSV